MSKVIVFAQINKGKLAKSSLIALTAARELQKVWGCTGVTAVALGEASQEAAQELLNYGVEEVRYSEDAVFSQYRAEPYARAIALAAKEMGANVVVGVANSTGKDALPRVAVLLDGAKVSDIIAVNEDGSLKRPMYAGNVIADVEVAEGARIVSVRGTAFAAAEPASHSGNASELALSGDPELVESPRFGKIVGYEESKADRPELTDAGVVVSGGRALGSAEKFEEVIFPLADALKGAVGASRAAVDSGYAPNDWQVGQTGKVVAPSLYIAVGISGAIQHLAGMKDSKVIVAINKDPDAPIFEVADYGLVADLFEVIPQLTAAVSAKS